MLGLMKFKKLFWKKSDEHDKLDELDHEFIAGFSSTCLTKATGSSVLSSALCLVRYCPLTLPVLIFP